MQSKNIQTDGTEYAYAQSYEWNSSYFGRRAHRVTIVSKGASRRIWSGYTSYTKDDGVVVHFVDEDRANEVVRPAEIRQLWTDYKAADDAATKARIERAHCALAEQQRIKARLDVAFATAPKAKRPYWTESEPSTDPYKGTMYGSELADLLDAVYAAGVDAGRADR